MGPLTVVIGSLVSIIFYGVILGGLYKIFQIGSDLGEIKDLLRDIKRHMQDTAAPAQAAPASAEALMRAVHGESYVVDSSLTGSRQSS